MVPDGWEQRMVTVYPGVEGVNKGWPGCKLVEDSPLVLVVGWKLGWKEARPDLSIIEAFTHPAISRNSSELPVQPEPPPWIRWNFRMHLSSQTR